jgi:hypothetical protein
MKRLLTSGPCYLALSLCLLLAAGCGKKGPPVVPVEGKVTVGGQPLTGGQISFIRIPGPEDTDEEGNVPQDMAAPSGTLDSGGQYKLFTGGKAGAPKGEYKVVVSPPMMPSPDGKMPMMPFDMKYGNPRDTPLRVTVGDNPAPGTYDFDLKKEL